ncbi:hypothetical protein Y919_02720 [Caloranaerobacter azorensis H53214]|uniref:HTH cro/C1-type domain-containing protein n=1 Tax=Caloranaerobacter azorensis H53214 TaxID=1156417 RepID=A0A096DPD8_9FIRM|nr:helix-turn-helix transcriptional regulator [Caloranaerobacter azorensis]KGG81086.1 hypothetical protein Y919_02720 [Caloranaerobacter azorensis H53214]
MQKDFKSLRQKTKLTTKEAAKKLGISLSMLYKIEQGHRKPSVDLIQRMSEVYSCSINDIFLALKITNRDNEITDIA